MVSNTGDQAKPTEFGLVSLDPFVAETVNTPFLLSFSQPISSFAVDFGDYGEDFPDILTLESFFSLESFDRDGELVASSTTTLSAPDDSESFSFAMGFLQPDAPVSTVRMIGGTANFPNSVFYDNISVELAVQDVPEPLSVLSLLVPGLAIASSIRRQRVR